MKLNNKLQFFSNLCNNTSNSSFSHVVSINGSCSSNEPREKELFSDSVLSPNWREGTLVQPTCL